MRRRTSQVVRLRIPNLENTLTRIVKIEHRYTVRVVTLFRRSRFNLLEIPTARIHYAFTNSKNRISKVARILEPARSFTEETGTQV
jgi:hypothetical protein